MIELKTKRLLLRTPKPTDAVALHQVFRDPEAMAYWSTLPHDQLKQTSDFVNAMISIPADEGVDLVVELDGKVIGKAGFWRFPEIGYIFHPEVWGQGIATEALTALLDYGFATLKLDHVVADVDPRNNASIVLLQNLGFEETGRAENTLLIGDNWCDSIYFT